MKGVIWLWENEVCVLGKVFYGWRVEYMRRGICEG